MSPLQSESLRLRTAELLAESFNREGLRYAVVSGLRDYPERVGRDLDVLVTPEDAPHAIFLAERVKRKLAWNHLLVRWNHHGAWQLFFIDEAPNALTWLEVDLCCGWRSLLVGAVPLFEDIAETIDAANHMRGPFRVSREGEYIKGYLRPLLYGDVGRFGDKHPLIQPGDDSTLRALERLMGRGLLDAFLRTVTLGPQEAARHSTSMKWRLNVRYAMRHPLRALRNLAWTRLVRPALLYLFNSGMVVAVVGPDGVGKSSAIREAAAYLSGLFDTRVRHWRPELLPAFGARKSGGEPNRVQPYLFEHGGRLAYYWLDFVLGYYLKDRSLPQAGIQLILYDRHALDSSVDPVRYRLSSPRGTQLLYRWTPRPERILLLSDSPEAIHGRKAELPLGELRRQLRLWNGMAEHGLVDHVISAKGSALETGRDVARCVLKVAVVRFGVYSSRVWRKLVLRRHGFANVVVNGRIRISYPCDAAGDVGGVARRLYRPYRSFHRWLYKAWWRVPLPTRQLRLSHAVVPCRLEGVDLDGLMEELRRVLERRDLVPVFYFPPQENRKKAAVVLLDSGGQRVAFARIAMDAAARSALAREVEAVSLLDTLDIKSFAFPRLIGRGSGGGVDFTVFVPVIEGDRGPMSWRCTLEAALMELREKTSHRRRLPQDFWLVPGTDDVWRRVEGFCREREPVSGYIHCVVHGDLAPWNARMVGRKLALLDWEESVASAPCLVDKVNFILSWQLEGARNGLRACAATLRRAMTDGERSDLALALWWIRRQGKYDDDALQLVATQALGLADGSAR